MSSGAVDARRAALIVASYEYQDPGLRRLRAPAQDAKALARVLRDPNIGDFDVRMLVNQPQYRVAEAVEEFFANRRPDDLLLLHFSCHGVKDEDGELYFAASNTKLQLLGATAVASEFVNRCMNRSRSRRVVLLLDCCYAGAFERGMVARADKNMAIEERFGGRGRAVITASSAMEYAFEGDELADTQDTRPSLFTGALVEGLETGDADRDQDGYVGLDELYDYVFDRVRQSTPNQTPGKWTFGVQGGLRIARRGRPVTKPAPLSPELQEAIGHPLAGIRAGAVDELEPLLHSAHPGLALAAQVALARLAEDDSKRVSSAAKAALRSAVATVARAEQPIPVRPDPGPEVGPRVTAAPAASRTPGTAWLPALVVAAGWTAAWPVSFGLAMADWSTNLVAGVSSALVGWVIVAIAVAAALRWAAPGLALSRALLIAVGWPICMLVGLAGPMALRLSYEGAALLGVGVAAAGFLGAMALVPPGKRLPWDRVLVVTVGWFAGWLWSGSTVWPEVFWIIRGGGEPQWGDFLSSRFVQLAAGGALSGMLGGILMYLLLLRRAATTRAR